MNCNYSFEHQMVDFGSSIAARLSKQWHFTLLTEAAMLCAAFIVQVVLATAASTCSDLTCVDAASGAVLVQRDHSRWRYQDGRGVQQKKIQIKKNMFRIRIQKKISTVFGSKKLSP